MKYRLFVVFGDEAVDIVNKQIESKYNDIKEEINIYEFNTKEEMDAFRKGLDAGVGNSMYQTLEENELVKIMEHTK